MLKHDADPLRLEERAIGTPIALRREAMIARPLLAVNRDREESALGRRFQ
ncbi:MAG: hypothetical protein AB7T14_08295 [Candidatus Methylacidiphilaceae bacterium]